MLNAPCLVTCLSPVGLLVLPHKMAPGVMSLSSPWRGQGPWGPGGLGAWGPGAPGPWGPGGWLWVDAADLRKHIRVYKLGERGPSIAAAAARRINTPTNTMEPSAPPRETGRLSPAASRGQGSSAVSTLTVFTFYSIFTLKCRP